MNLDLEGCRVLITGGSKGIGLACARGFLAEGAHVAMTSRSDANLSNARASLGQVLTVSADLADATAARGTIDRVSWCEDADAPAGQARSNRRLMPRADETVRQRGDE